MLFFFFVFVLELHNRVGRKKTAEINTTVCGQCACRHRATAIEIKLNGFIHSTFSTRPTTAKHTKNTVCVPIELNKRESDKFNTAEKKTNKSSKIVYFFFQKKKKIRSS